MVETRVTVAALLFIKNVIPKKNVIRDLTLIIANALAGADKSS